jgi:hypothetical protein
MGHVSYVGWATNSCAIVMIRLYVFEKGGGVVTDRIGTVLKDL